ncbi:hypothetical protein D9611_008070 [Ephemerocybe angulata]|uniref:Ribonucleoside-diphosphate reductase n=1 Tax=Ephemerocybe angulata TaxID=980116 RepID=A0A8H5FD47_9AGAR|nr:hypothetical protein D9611_008070 [Tulosesus angulatus]
MLPLPSSTLQIFEDEGLAVPDSRITDKISSTALSICSPSVESCDIDAVLAQVTGSLETLGTEYALLSSVLERSTMYEVTPVGFGDAMKAAYLAQAITAEFMTLVEKNERALNAMIRHEEDRRLNYWALRTLRSSCLLRDGARLLERPQHMLLRVALYMHLDHLEDVQDTYMLMATHKLFPSVEILTGCGTSKTIFKPCYAIRMTAENMLASIQKIVTLVRDGADVGVGVQGVASRGSTVDGVVQSGIALTISALEATLQAWGNPVDTPSGSLSIYVEPWHCDIERILRLIRTRSKVTKGRARLEFGFLINDLFLYRVRSNKSWTLFCPTYASQLESLHGTAFDDEYCRVEGDGHNCKQIGAQKLWKNILDTLIETGGPFIMFKDTVYAKCGRRSNLGDPTTFVGKEHVLEACLHGLRTGSMLTLILPSFVTAEGVVDLQSLGRVTRQAVGALNALVDHAPRPRPPVDVLERSPTAIRIGTGGFSDLIAALGHSYDSQAARETNVAIAELVQYTALDQSCALMKTRGPILSHHTCTIGAGFLQDHLWSRREPSDRYDWEALQARVAAEGLRNSDVTVYESDAASCLITACSDSCEPFRSLISVFNGPSGMFASIPRHLMVALEREHVWEETLRDRIIENRGSIQTLGHIAPSIRSVYRTVWDIEQSSILRLALDRAPFLCRGQDVRFYLPKSCSDALADVFFREICSFKGGKAVFPLAKSAASGRRIRFVFGPYLPVARSVVEPSV